MPRQLAGYHEQLDTFVDLLGERLVIVVLNPGAAVCVQRNATRPAADQFVFNDYKTLHASMRHSLAGAARWLDSSRQTPQQTAREVLAHCQIAIGRVR